MANGHADQRARAHLARLGAVWVAALLAADFRPTFENYIRDVAAHYRGRVVAWDVVNEAMADDGSACGIPCSGRSSAIGYIADAFRLARQADPAGAADSTTTTAGKG